MKVNGWETIVYKSSITDTVQCQEFRSTGKSLVPTGSLAGESVWGDIVHINKVNWYHGRHLSIAQPLSWDGTLPFAWVHDLGPSCIPLKVWIHWASAIHCSVSECWRLFLEEPILILAPPCNCRCTSSSRRRRPMVWWPTVRALVMPSSCCYWGTPFSSLSSPVASRPCPSSRATISSRLTPIPMSPSGRYWLWWDRKSMKNQYHSIQ